MGDDVKHPQSVYDEVIETAIKEGVRHIDGAFVCTCRLQLSRLPKIRLADTNFPFRRKRT